MRLRGPVAEDLEFGCGDVVDEEGHGSAQTNGFISDFVRVESGGCLSTKR